MMGELEDAPISNGDQPKLSHSVSPTNKTEKSEIENALKKDESGAPSKQETVDYGK